MLTEAEKRAAEWVVSRYGLDPGQIEQLIQNVLQARADGRSFDLFEAMLQEQVLPPAQVHDLRLALDNTRIDPKPFPDEPSTNGSPAGDPMAAVTLPPSPPRSVELRGEPIPDVRSLGEYRLLRRLGEGGMGAVFLGYQEATKEYVALKVLAPNLAKTQDLLDRFSREGRSGALLNHPNIVRNLGVGHDAAADLHYLVLEYVDGPSGQELLERFGRLFVADAVHIILDIARALEHAHSRNLVHRDIKPGNILVTQSGMAKLSDLGLAKRTDEASHLTQTKQGFGTPYYMPYEQALNAKYADARSDIYALGATFYHFLVGEVPFQGKNSLEIIDKKNLGIFTPASVLNTDVPNSLDHILDKMLAREPANRYQTVSELIVDLERSNLAASVPSFTDPDKALEDPLMRQRLLRPPPPTEFDLRNQDGADAGAASSAKVWYFRYLDRHGQLCMAKATEDQVLQRLQQGTLAPNSEASPNPNGNFQPLTAYTEFTAVAKAPPTEDDPDPWPMYLVTGLGVVAIIIILVLVISAK